MFDSGTYLPYLHFLLVGIPTYNVYNTVTALFVPFCNLAYPWMAGSGRYLYLQYLRHVSLIQGSW